MDFWARQEQEAKEASEERRRRKQAKKNGEMVEDQSSRSTMQTAVPWWGVLLTGIVLFYVGHFIGGAVGTIISLGGLILMPVGIVQGIITALKRS